MNKDITTIDAFIAQFPAEVQSQLQQIRALVHQLVPEATEAICYGIPTFKLNGNMLHFAAYPKHIGFYPGAAAMVDFQDRFSNYQTSKGTVQFPLLEPLPMELIADIIRYRAEVQMAKKKPAKSAKPRR